MIFSGKQRLILACLGVCFCSSFPPLTYSLESSMDIGKDFFAAAVGICTFGSSVKGRRWVGGEGGREWPALWVY